MASRKKIYYPDHQITKDLYTKGGEWMTTDGTEYFGPYHTYTTGEVFTFPDWDEKFSQKLIPLRVTAEEADKYRRARFGITDPTTGEMEYVRSALDVKRYESPRHRIIEPTQDDFKKGHFTRYVVGKRNDADYPLREITANEATMYNSATGGINSFLYKVVEVEWKLTGPERDILNPDGSIKTPGVFDTNRRSVFSADGEMRGVSNLLRDVRQYTIYEPKPTSDNQ